VLNAPTTKEKTRVDFGPTMNQPSVDSTDVDIVDTSQDVEVNMNIVTPTKKVKKSTKGTRALNPQRQRT
jgi:hypothetical protein